MGIKGSNFPYFKHVGITMPLPTHPHAPSLLPASRAFGAITPAVQSASLLGPTKDFP